MPDYPNRPKFEAALANALEAAFSAAREDVSAGRRLTLPGISTRVGQETRGPIKEAFAAVYVLMLASDIVDPFADQLASSYATVTSRRIGIGVAQNSASAIAAGTDPAVVFGSSRAAAVAITETTRTITAAEIEARRTVAGRQDGSPLVIPRQGTLYVGPQSPLTIPDGLEATWWTERDGRVCKVCSRLHLKRYTEWAVEIPFGPPAHVRCRCWLEYSPLRESISSRFSRFLREAVAAFSAASAG